MSVLQKKRRKDRQGNASALPKSLFGIVGITGAVLIWVLKWASVYPLIIVLFPVSLILLYCFLSYKTSLFYVREEQIGDNAYYLGFLFTLSSLAYALFNFRTGHGGDPGNIIESFGVALWSTIVGIIMRVTFSQMGQDPESIEKEARAKVAQMASMLASDLYQASVTFNSYTKGLQQSVDEAFVQAKEISSRTVSSLEALNQKIHLIEAPDSLINRKIDSIFSDLEGATNKLNGLAMAQTGSVENLIGSSSQLVDGIKSLNKHIVTMGDNSAIIGTGISNFQKITDLVRDLQEELKKLSGGFTELNDRQAKAIDGIANHASALDQQLEKSRQYTVETHDSLASMTRTLAEKLK